MSETPVGGDANPLMISEAEVLAAIRINETQNWRERIQNREQ